MIRPYSIQSTALPWLRTAVQTRRTQSKRRRRQLQRLEVPHFFAFGDSWTRGVPWFGGSVIGKVIDMERWRQMNWKGLRVLIPLPCNI